VTDPDNDGALHDQAGGVALIREAVRVRSIAANETVTRQTIVAKLLDMYPVVRPWWLEAHIAGAERLVAFAQAGQERRGFGDSIVGLTAIEYERDLRVPDLLRTGTLQVRQYCTGLLNEGADPERVRGVLSDGVEWRGFRLDLGALPARGAGGAFDVDDVVLLAPEVLVCDAPNAEQADRLAGFLGRYLGRAGTRPLTGSSVSAYLGFDTTLGTRHLRDLRAAVGDEIAASGETGALIQELWTTFVRYLSVEPEGAVFDLDSYVEEFYLSILARLLCANVIARRPLRSDDAELESIVTGRHFEAKGLHRLVEFDYFGWLTVPERLARVVPIARAIQRDLSAFDVEAPVAQDLFGQMMSALAQRTRRLLLGQEWTPSWLAKLLAEHLLHALDDGTSPRFVDMCCGSGAMLVAVTDATRARLTAGGTAPGDRAGLDTLVQAATGFDIDPVAVILAKVNWVVANREWLEPLDGSYSVSIPVYHADSLFALGPLFDPARPTVGASDYQIRVDDELLDLPGFLIESGAGPLFDAVIEGAYSLAEALRDGNPLASPEQAMSVLSDAVNATGSVLTPEQSASASRFARLFATKIAVLMGCGRDGIWSFVVRNSLRPSLLRGRFNGLISNPPWLAMSRIAHNPFSAVLREKAAHYGLVPPGSAFLHLELSTAFLAHAIDSYLEDGALVGCVVPDTIRNGMQHGPFRAQTSGKSADPARVLLDVHELWLVDADVFKNKAAILLGRKGSPSDMTTIAGRSLGRSRSTAITSHVISRGDRLIWSLNEPGEGIPGGYPPGFARQGADLMPRRLVFVATRAVGTSISVRTPDRTDREWYLVSDAKKHLRFSIVPRTLPARFVHGFLGSKHVAPFVIAASGCAVLPIAWSGPNGRWYRATDADIATSPAARDHFRDAIRESGYADIREWWEALDYRGKLTRQVMQPDRWLVVYGAGGTYPAAACARVGDLGPEPPVIDQTLYWAIVDEDEAAYLTGLINSDALLERIADFIPEGAFGPRHIHTLPSKSIPEFDRADARHLRVADAVRVLTPEVLALGTIRDNAHLFDAATDLRRRRGEMRDLISRLPAYGEYATACADVYPGGT
jgi:methylase of polypeptide subunit release factors